MYVIPAVMDGADSHFDGVGTLWRADFSGLGQLELGNCPSPEKSDRQGVPPPLKWPSAPYITAGRTDIFAYI